MQLRILKLLFLAVFHILLLSQCLGAEQIGIVVAKSGAKLRKEPNFKGEKIATIAVEEQVVILGESDNFDTFENTTSKWLQVRYHNNVGWVFGTLIHVEPNVPVDLSASGNHNPKPNSEATVPQKSDINTLQNQLINIPNPAILASFIKDVGYEFGNFTGHNMENYNFGKWFIKWSNDDFEKLRNAFIEYRKRDPTFLDTITPEGYPSIINDGIESLKQGQARILEEFRIVQSRAKALVAEMKDSFAKIDDKDEYFFVQLNERLDSDFSTTDSHVQFYFEGDKASLKKKIAEAIQYHKDLERRRGEEKRIAEKNELDKQAANDEALKRQAPIQPPQSRQSGTSDGDLTLKDKIYIVLGVLGAILFWHLFIRRRCTKCRSTNWELCSREEIDRFVGDKQIDIKNQKGEKISEQHVSVTYVKERFTYQCLDCQNLFSEIEKRELE